MVGQWATVEEVDAQHSRLRMTADNLDWPTFALGMLGADFEVVSAPELAQHVQEWPARFALYALRRSSRLVQTGVELAGVESDMEWFALVGPLERLGHG